MRINYKYSVVLTAAIIIFAGTSIGTAQTPASLPDVLTLEAATDVFLQKNLSIEAARLQVTRAEADRVAARLRPRPTANISAENLRIAGPTPFNRLYEAGVVVSQPLELGGQRSARRELAEKTVSLAEATLLSAIRQRQFEFRRAFYEVLLAEAVLGLETDNQTNFAELVRYNTVRLNEGEISPGEMLKVRLEKIKYDSATAAARLAYRQAKVKLLELLGETDFSHIEELQVRDKFEFVDFATNLAALRSLALQNGSNVKVAEAEIERLGALLRLERARAKGEITPYSGYKRVGPDNTAVVGVTVPLPFGNRNQGEIARAEAERKIAENVLKQELNRAVADVQTAYLAFETAREQVKAFEAGVLTQADESLNIMLLSYREGATDLVNLLDAQRTRNEVRALYFRSVLAYYLSLFELERVTGTEIRK